MTKINFIKERQLLIDDFVKIYIKSMEENKSLQYMFLFSPNYNIFYPKVSFDIEKIENVIRFNTNGRWIQLFDNEYVGFKKATLEDFNTENLMVLSNDEIEKAKQNYIEFKKEVIKEFYLSSNYENLYNQLSKFEALDYNRGIGGRNIIYSQAFTNNTGLNNFKPLHIKNWLNFYSEIFNLHFNNFKTVRNNLNSVVYEKQINSEISIQIEIDKKRLAADFKVDYITIPNLFIYLVVNNESTKFFYYVPYRHSLICNSSEDTEYVKRLCFFEINVFLKLHLDILNLIINGDSPAPARSVL